MNLLILAKSYKGKGYCIAGIDLSTNKYVRIGKGNSCDALSQFDITIQNKEIDLLDVIDVTVGKLPDNGCHTEDYQLYSLDSILDKYTIEQLNDLYDQLTHPTNIFGCFNKYIPSPCNSRQSLILLKVNNFSSYQILSSYDGKYKGKSKFYYRNILCNDYSLTDSNISGFQYRREFSELNLLSCFVLISLPEDDWAQNNGYYKYVAGVIY